jgi:hypothetical protein
MLETASQYPGSCYSLDVLAVFLKNVLQLRRGKPVVGLSQILKRLTGDLAPYSPVLMASIEPHRLGSQGPKEIGLKFDRHGRVALRASVEYECRIVGRQDAPLGTAAFPWQATQSLHMARRGSRLAVVIWLRGIAGPLPAWAALAFVLAVLLFVR